MTELPDFQLIKTRISLVDLLKSFFYDEPDANKLGLWRGVIFALSSQSISPEMDEAVASLSESLSGTGLQELKDEYYELFVNPFSRQGLHTTASYYRDGHNFGTALVECREFLKKAGIEKRQGITETEDSLPVLLDVYQELIGREKNDAAEASALEAEFLGRFLLPLGNAMEKAVENNRRASFYKACCRFLNAYLLMERALTFDPSGIQSTA